MSVLTSFKHLGFEQWRVPRRNVCFSSSLSHPRGSPRGVHLHLCPSPREAPEAARPGLRPRPRLPGPLSAATRPGIPRGCGHLVATLHPTAVPFRACPGESPFPPLSSLPVQFRSRRRAGTRLPPPDPQRRALTELLCPSGPTPVRLRLAAGGGSGLALWPRGPARTQSAAPTLLPQVRWGPPPLRLRPLSRPRRPAAAAVRATARCRHVTRPRGRGRPRDPVGPEGRGSWPLLGGRREPCGVDPVPAQARKPSKGAHRAYVLERLGQQWTGIGAAGRAGSPGIPGSPAPRPAARPPGAPVTGR